MGAYLSEPITDKISSDGDSDRVRYGASSMQGWRVSQEDAHNCVVEFDKNTSLFAVYDGHGGHEVAVYCSNKLPDFIKDTDAYKTGDYKQALIDAFMGFDATIATRDIVDVLKQIAGSRDNDNAEEMNSDDDDENVNNLYEEASMPIEQVMEKYQANLLNPNLKKIQNDNKLPISPMLKARKQGDEGSGASSSKVDSTPQTSGSKVGPVSETNVVSSAGSDVSCSESIATSTSNGETVKAESNLEEPTTTHSEIPEIKITKEEDSNEVKQDSKADAKADSTDSKVVANGEAIAGSTDDTCTPTQENGELSPKGKGKALLKKIIKAEVTANVKNLRSRNARQLYSKLLDFEEESDTEDENDETFEGVPSASSSEGDGDESSEGADDEGEDDEEEEEDTTEEVYDEENEFTRNMTEEPGSDSGCTAVVALLRGTELFVANAGDSRCIVCRNGQAVEMSLDHKPEDKLEMDRVVKAGGKVTQDGRVNGGLNLSRAIGDHAYKQNKDLNDREQMITALPDIRTLTINPGEDDFMVLACDGIWNYMSSQEVVDFVKPRLQESTGRLKLSQICEEMFDHCLAPHTMGDGTGCDNMTAVIVQFKNGVKKRGASPDCSADDTKRVKTETAEPKL